MAQPTQQLPPWLSYSTTAFTNAAGSPVLTSSSLIYLPLTYYGPSIPLNSLWTYGGLTSPASTSIIPTSPPSTVPTITHTPSTSAIPLSSPTPSTAAIPPSSPTPSTPATPHLSSSASVMLSTTASISSSTPPIPSSSPPPTTTVISSPLSPSHSGTESVPPPAATISAPPPVPTMSNSSRNALVAIVLGAILGSVLLLLLILIALRWRVRRNRHRRVSSYTFEPPIWADWVDAAANSTGNNSYRDRPLGEGSPRLSGGETDPFLTVHRGPEDSGAEMQQADSSARLVTKRDSGLLPPEATAAIRASADTETSSAASGYGTLLDPPPVASPERLRGHIVPPSDLLRMDTGNVEPAQEPYSPLLPPPRIDPDRPPGRRSHYSEKPSQQSFASHLTDTEEAPTLSTARRVRISPYPAAEGQVPSGGPSGLASSLGIGLSALAGLGRLSWFKNKETPFNKRSRPSSYVTRPLSDYEVETGKALLSEQQTSSPSRPVSGSGANVDRPVSGLSAISGNTIYHDAPSSPPETPELTPLPRVLTPAGQVPVSSQSPPTSGSGGAGGSNEPPTNEHEGHILDMHSPTQANLNLTFPPGVDILDIPAPPPASPFASSSSSRGSMGNFPFPPGLASISNIRSSIAGTMMSGLGASDSDAIAIDVLEEEPPSAGQSWRSIAAAEPSGVDGERRSTFGLARLLHPNDSTPEHESLHSMRSRHSPHSRSSGSAPASAAHPSGGSGSSHSVLRTATGSSGHSHGSLAHSASISSEDRRRGRAVGATSPAVSALGGGRAVTDHGYLTPYPSPPSSPLAAVHKDTIINLTSMDTGMSQASTSSQVMGAPWAGGLDAAWSPK